MQEVLGTAASADEKQVALALAALLELGVDPDAVKVLVEAGAELGAKDRAWGATPLGWAAYYRNAEISSYLRERGARD